MNNVYRLIAGVVLLGSAVALGSCALLLPGRYTRLEVRFLNVHYALTPPYINVYIDGERILSDSLVGGHVGGRLMKEMTLVRGSHHVVVERVENGSAVEIFNEAYDVSEAYSEIFVTFLCLTGNAGDCRVDVRPSSRETLIPIE